MKILHVICSVGTGGAERHVLDLCLALRLAGVTVEVALPVRGELGGQLERQGIACHEFGVGHRFNPLMLVRLRHIVHQTGSDVVHAHMPRSASMARWGKGNAVCVATAHNMVKHGRPFRHCERVICVSDMVCRSLNKQGYPLDRTTVIHNAVDIARFTGHDRERIRTQMGWQDEIIVLCVARLVPAKGQSLALAALARLANPNVRLVLAGAGPDEDMLRKQITELGITHQVQLVGNRQDIPQLLSASDIYLQPSLKEGFGIAFLEAMASGLAGIGTRTGAMPEMVHSGRNGLLVEANDVEALVTALRSLCNNSLLRQQLGEQAARDARSRFSLQRQAQDTLTVYQHALAKRH